MTTIVVQNSQDARAEGPGISNISESQYTTSSEKVKFQKRFFRTQGVVRHNVKKGPGSKNRETDRA
jgi:hypothetical protein